MNLDDLTFIFTYRKIMDSVVFKNPTLFKVWMWCLFKATHNEKKKVKIITGKGTSEVIISRGQFIFGRNSAAKELDLPPSTIRNKLEKLKKLRKVDIQPDRHYSIVSITNWERYQVEIPKKWREIGQAKDRQRTGKGHNQEGKELKERKEKILPEWLDPVLWNEFMIHRKAIRKPLTEQAISLNINRLKKLKDSGEDLKAVIEQTIANRYTSVFKVNGGKFQQEVGPQPGDHVFTQKELAEMSGQK